MWVTCKSVFRSTWRGGNLVKIQVMDGNWATVIPLPKRVLKALLTFMFRMSLDDWHVSTFFVEEIGNSTMSPCSGAKHCKGFSIFRFRLWDRLSLTFSIASSDVLTYLWIDEMFLCPVFVDISLSLNPDLCSTLIPATRIQWLVYYLLKPQICDNLIIRFLSLSLTTTPTLETNPFFKWVEIEYFPS